MKRVLWIADCVALLVSTTGCALPPDERLKRYTDIDVAGTGILVTVVHREDLDQVGYNVSLTGERQRVFQNAVANAAGAECVQGILSASGCHYKSKAGHNVFVIKAGTNHYTIYTSG